MTTKATRSAIILLLVCAGLPLPFLSGQTPELRTLFTQQAPVFVTTDRLSRLELPTAVLEACRPDLSDLRVFDATGNEVPFLVDSGIPPETEAALRQTYTLEIADVSRQEVRSEASPRVFSETYELVIPAAVAQNITDAASWDLVFVTPSPGFVRQVRIAARVQNRETAPLVDDASIFRIANPRREKTRLTLPRLQAGRLIVTLEGEGGSFLTPSFQLETSRSFRGRERAVVALEVLNRREVERATILELRRPVGLSPDSLRLETALTSFSRQVQVWDEGPGGTDSVLGEENLFRVQAAATVEDVDLTLRPARGDRLRVVIENGDSPPLADAVFQAVVQRPALVFALTPAAGQEPSGMLRFGGSRAFRPQYDLGRLGSALQLPSAGERAEVAEQLLNLPPVRLGDIEPNPNFNPSPILAFAMRPGAAIDPRLYTHRREIEAGPSGEGLLRFTLGVEDLAHTLPDLADLRIVDFESRQWAYLLERDAAHVTRSLDTEKLESENGSTEYTFSLPVSPSTLDQLVLETPVPFFDRAYHVVGLRDKKDVSLAQGRMVRRVGDPRPVRIPLPTGRIESLKLVIVDGDDAPLKFPRVEGRFPVPAVYFAAPQGSYAALLGNPEDRAPQYEIARIRNVVLAVKNVEVGADDLKANPAYSAGARLVTESGIQQTVLWIVLVIAVIFLGLLTLRLARQSPGASTEGP
ncbi:MAG: hypothetical protein O2968_03530 [Acidobacteria bacterium]|nr:hypothetical protein [Acidobacteriota bacterium]